MVAWFQGLLFSGVSWFRLGEVPPPTERVHYQRSVLKRVQEAKLHAMDPFGVCVCVCVCVGGGGGGGLEERTWTMVGLHPMSGRVLHETCVLRLFF